MRVEFLMLLTLFPHLSHTWQSLKDGLINDARRTWQTEKQKVKKGSQAPAKTT